MKTLAWLRSLPSVAFVTAWDRLTYEERRGIEKEHRAELMAKRRATGRWGPKKYRLSDAQAQQIVIAQDAMVEILADRGADERAVLLRLRGLL